jgi:plastocyanin
VVIAAEITAFHVLGGVLALWALVVFALGVRSHDFPPKGAEKIVIGISAVLVFATIGSAVATSGEEEPKGHEVTGTESKAGKEGSSEPEAGGTPAPDTGTESGQEPAGETGQKPPGGQTAQTLRLTAGPGPEFRFNTAELESKPGNVTIVLTNSAPLPHNVSLEGPGGLDEDGKIVQKGGESQVTAQLKPGEYTYYCRVAGHREGGMEGILTVVE